MARQHAEAVVAGFYDYTEGRDLETPHSAYARRYMEFKLGQVGNPDEGRHYSVNPAEREVIRARIDRELRR
jgi:hypothetical protein